ncbi:MAG: Spore peptidoglycan hydrolase [Firmicutes bacterium]|nr:Spore peptidoglycan hydrolase [Bacillota bacterium]
MKKAKKIAMVGALTLMVTIGSHSIAGAAIIHSVEAGDTYWKISQRYGVSLTELLSANGANENSVLYVGQQVIVPTAGETYRVRQGDTFWIISQRVNVSVNELMQVNGANDKTVLYVGQTINLPPQVKSYTVKQGDTFWIISSKFGVGVNSLMEANGANQNTILYPGMVLLIPQPPQNNTQKPSVTYITHTVQKGDDFWQLGIKYGVPYGEILEANGLNENSVLYIGQKLRIPVHNIPVKSTPGPQYGELLDWWTEAQYVWPIGVDAKITDFYTGISWNARRTIGSNHADVEPLTAKDTETMKKVWGGSWSWGTRPVIVEVKGRRLAASASAMPHDIQYITNNGFNGHFDVHFLNSTRHKDGAVDEDHQQKIHIAAGK